MTAEDIRLLRWQVDRALEWSEDEDGMRTVPTEYALPCARAALMLVELAPLLDDFENARIGELETGSPAAAADVRTAVHRLLATWRRLRLTGPEGRDGGM